MNEKKLSIGSNLLWGQVGRTYGCSDCTIIQHLDTQCWDTRLGQRIYLLHTLTTYNEAFLSISVIGVFCQNLIEWQHNKSCSNSQMTCISTTLSSSTWTSEDNQFNFVGIHGKTCTWIHIFISKLILLENFFCPQWNLMCHQHTQYSIQSIHFCLESWRDHLNTQPSSFFIWSVFGSYQWNLMCHQHTLNFFFKTCLITDS